MQLQEVLLDLSDNEDVVTIVGGNESETVLAHPTSECESLLDDLKGSKKNHVRMLLAMCIGFRSVLNATVAH